MKNRQRNNSCDTKSINLSKIFVVSNKFKFKFWHLENNVKKKLKAHMPLCKFSWLSE